MSGYPGCGRITHVCPPVETRNTPVTITPTFPDVALRDALVRAINGWPISPELAWAILHRWDANSQQRRSANSQVGAWFVCAGCNVREPFEHRCHRDDGTACFCDMCGGRACTCEECVVGGGMVAMANLLVDEDGQE